MTESLVVGVDAGATSTRVSVHTLDGRRVGYARAAAGNPTAHGLARAVAAIGAALKEALDSLDGSRVAASLAGVAGHTAAMVPELAALWAAHGIPQPPVYVRDVTIAYAAGSAEPDGSLLLSGTGAVATRVAGFEVARIADGLGWLLGDQGSGFWIGREAAKAVIASLDRGRLPVPGDLLTDLVLTHVLGQERPETPRAIADRVVRVAQADHMGLAALAAPVSKAAAAGDPVAEGIVRRAAGHLVATLRRVHVSGPVVLAGSVLTNDGPVRDAVTELLAGERVATARDGAGAAAWLAARPLLTEPEAASRHAAFTTAP
ncbi:BadF/BadG/BcrA/BcrD ATPase family protein [Nonomuraea sp. NPDC004580]|uniref:N-acetylglucosamine kinase n=1 Tax=Nonomuraea sp. NPDC004580 TaxID=3154552 RepID=UPI0033BF68F1